MNQLSRFIFLHGFRPRSAATPKLDANHHHHLRRL